MAKRAKSKSGTRKTGLPSKKEIIAYLENADGEVARRDIARAFGVKGEARADLRRLSQRFRAVFYDVFVSFL